MSDDTSDLIPPARKLRYIEPEELFDENDQTPVQPVNTADLILCVFGDAVPANRATVACSMARTPGDE